MCEDFTKTYCDAKHKDKQEFKELAKTRKQAIITMNNKQKKEFFSNYGYDF